MARCHQWHNIPWQALVDCLEVQYFRNHPRPPRLLAKTCGTEEELVRRTKRIRFFTSRLHATVAEFAATERRKYDLDAILARDKVFDDEYLSDILTPQYQSLEFWRRRRAIPASEPYYPAPEAEVINELFNVGNMEAVLLLVHTGIGIRDVEACSRVDSSSLFDLAERCMAVYVHLNYLIASGDIARPHRWTGSWRTVAMLGRCRCFSPRNDGRRVLRQLLPCTEAGFADYSGVTQLLRYCFRICYQYKMVSEEIHRACISESPYHSRTLHAFWQPWDAENRERWTLEVEQLVAMSMAQRLAISAIRHGAGKQA